ncbi:MAG TPA: hypothetical protein VHA12_01110 [Candidatus Nanoarchaeia archaeon]|nr:hypothetical protein [Candidatus Nanoarchaeia archaeon]
MPFKDAEKRKAYRRQWYARNSSKEIKHVRMRKREIRNWFDNYKSGLECSICGEKHPATIDFHHKLSEQKEQGIANMVANGYSITKIKEELSKCQILCSNCHRKLHYSNKKL